MRILFSLLIFSFCLNSCAKKKAEEQAKTDDAILSQYVIDNNLTVHQKVNGLYVIMDEEGVGEYPNPSADVKVAYKGYFTDGSVFDESSEQGITFGLNQVISGWTQGIPYFNKGGKGKLLIPSALAYGKDGTQGIPPNSVLIFDIHLIDIYQ
jgi:FKBP-type peptidyl-prolyl cis-trans isomerase FkpA